MEEFVECAYPGASAIATRIACLAVKGDLHTDIHKLQRNIRSIDSPLTSQLCDRMNSMKSNGWRFWEISSNEMPGAMGQYDPPTREVTLARQARFGATTPYWAYLLGVTAEHPYAKMTGVLSHEVAHHDGLKHFPSRYLHGQSAERLVYFRELAYETNAFIAQIHVEQASGGPVFSQTMLDALKKHDLGGAIYDHYQSRERPPISRAEANGFVNEYIAERWGNPLDADGKVKPYELNPPPSALEESKIYDPNRLEALNMDAAAEREKLGSESLRNRLSRTLQSRVGSATVHGVKIFGAVGMCAAAHSVRFSFHDSLGSGLGETAKIGIGFGGFEAGAAIARATGGSTLGKTLALGFLGACAAENIIGRPVHRLVKAIVD